MSKPHITHDRAERELIRSTPVGGEFTVLGSPEQFAEVNKKPDKWEYRGVTINGHWLLRPSIYNSQPQNLFQDVAFLAGDEFHLDFGQGVPPGYDCINNDWYNPERYIVRFVAVEDERVVKVQDLGEDELSYMPGFSVPPWIVGISQGEPVESEHADKDPWWFFAELWDSRFPKHPYDSNPFVAQRKFRVTHNTILAGQDAQPQTTEKENI